MSGSASCVSHVPAERVTLGWNCALAGQFRGQCRRSSPGRKAARLRNQSVPAAVHAGPTSVCAGDVGHTALLAGRALQGS